MMRLRVAHHAISSAPMVEILSDTGQLIGCIYPTNAGVKIVSKYIVNHETLVAIEIQEPPALLIDLAAAIPPLAAGAKR